VYYYRMIIFIYGIYCTARFLIILMFKVSTLEDFPFEVIEKCNPKLYTVQSVRQQKCSYHPGNRILVFCGVFHFPVDHVEQYGWHASIALV
jgi:hypothetical protein